MTAPSTDPFILGLTGNIGSGKSTVAELWKSHGCRVIEGDRVGRDVADQSTEFRDWLRWRFGDALFDGDTLLRAELGKIVFADKKSRDDLNDAIWPYIRRRLAAEIDDALRAGQIALVDAAMIFEWDDAARYDVIVAVVVDPMTGARRAAERMGRPVDEIIQRYRMQIPAAEKAERSDFVLENRGGLEELRAAAETLWPRVLSRGRARVGVRRPEE